MIKLAKNIVKLLNQKRLTTVAGAWVFYFLTAIIPLVFLLITAFGVFGVDIATDLAQRLPEEFRTAGESIVNTASAASKGATLLFVITAAYSCVRLINQMSKDGDHIYLEKVSTKRGAMRKAWALLALCALFAVFLCLAFVIGFGSDLFSFSYKADGLRRLLTTICVAFVVIAVSFFIIVILNVFISPVKLKLSQIAIGGLFSLFAIVLGTLGFALYVRLFNSYNAFYGSLAGVVIFLLWAYILMLGMVLGVIINAKIYNRHQKTQT